MGKKNISLAAPSKAIDPTLDALFSGSAGPVQPPSITRYSELRKRTAPAETTDADEVLSEISEELSYGEDDDEEDAEGDEDASEDEEEESAEDAAEQDSDDGAPAAAEATVVDTEKPSDSQPERKRKRKRRDDNEDLEGKYLAELTKGEADEPADERLKTSKADEDKDGESDDEPLVHESVSQKKDSSDIEKSARTVFLSNVSIEAISSKSAKKTLLNHLSKVLPQDESPPQKIESIRFRSVAFSTGAMPKRAAYITGAVMGATTKSTNAYVVYPTAALARKAATDLNGTEVLDRHIRVDNVAHPSPTDHRRCVFVGNLAFVDDETILNKTPEGETVEKKRNKAPADVEEGLWRTFGKKWKVENVRVIRDPKTRVSKGFAYVQFYDANDVEAALLLDGKKFPPMLPRNLRVTRAKDPRKTALAQERKREKSNAANAAAAGNSTKYKRKFTAEEQSHAGRVGKLLGKSAASQQRRAAFSKKGAPADKAGEGGDLPAAFKTPEQIVFEGTRASANNNDNFSGRKHKRPRLGKDAKSGRGARRASEWKKKKAAEGE